MVSYPIFSEGFGQFWDQRRYVKNLVYQNKNKYSETMTKKLMQLIPIYKNWLVKTIMKKNIENPKSNWTTNIRNQFKLKPQSKKVKSTFPANSSSSIPPPACAKVIPNDNRKSPLSLFSYLNSLKPRDWWLATLCFFVCWRISLRILYMLSGLYRVTVCGFCWGCTDFGFVVESNKVGYRVTNIK